MRARFDDFVFDSQTRQLSRDGRPVPLSPRAFELLGALLESRPRALSSDELRERVWPETHVAGTNLRRVMNEVRAVLGDDAREPRYVRTLHGHGYAFVAPAEDLEGAAPASVSCWIERGSWRLPLGEGVHPLGRDPTAAIPLSSVQASRQHARIHVSRDRVELEDLGSKNGTFLGGKPVRGRVPLRDGAEIGIGDEILVFRLASAEEATQTAQHD